jgi:pantothenate kinase
MPDQFENKLIDKRVVQRYMEKGLVADKDFEQYLRKLPDLTEQAVAVESEIEEEGGVA